MQDLVRGQVTKSMPINLPFLALILGWLPCSKHSTSGSTILCRGDTCPTDTTQATAVTATQSGLGRGRGCTKAALALGCNPSLYHMRSLRFQSGPVPSVSRCRAQRARQLHCSCSILPSPQLQDVLQPSRQQCRFDQQQHGPKTVEQLHEQQQQNQQQHQAQPWQMTRRDAVVLPVMGGLALQLGSWVQPRPAAASKLGAAADSAWEAIGGGPADLTFPESW